MGWNVSTDDFDPYDRSSVLRGLLSPLQPHLDDKNNTEIAINRPFEIWTENQHGWHKHQAPKLDFHHLKRIATTFAVFNSLEINSQNPICSGVLPDGQRGQVIIPSACENGTVSITIRQPNLTRFEFDDYQNSGRLDRWVDVSTFQTDNTVFPTFEKDRLKAQSEEIKFLSRYLGVPSDVQLQLFELQMLKAKADRDTDKFIRLAVENRQNICLIGATGSGKTTFTKAVCDLVPFETRIVTIEDTAELDLPRHLNRVHLFYKDVTPKMLLASCMRMKPDRIFLTELRGDEAYDYLNTLNTGHAGSVTTVHANDCNSAYYRVATLIKQSQIGSKVEFEQIIRDVYTTIDVMVYLNRTYVKQIAYDPIRKARLQQGKAL